MNLEYGEIKSRLIEPRSNEVATVFEAANRQVIEFSLTILKKKQFGGEPCFDLMDLLGHTYI